mmetsp:Transcript_15087/g.30407  ORF Transcript_15087/g.30407 Transcript_15087/m.30407 type:complete len:272 (+) Transcript_15087:826-1641(+)
MPINIMVVDEITEPRRPHSDQKMAMLKRDHGVIKYLDQAITAPDRVMQAMRNAAQIHTVLIGSERTEKSMQQRNLMDDVLCKREDGSLQSGCVITVQGKHSYKHSGQISRYSREIFTRTDEIPPARLLKKGVNPEAVAELQRDIDGIRADLQQRIPRQKEEEEKHLALQAEGQDFTKRRDVAKAKKQNIANAQRKVRDARVKLQGLEEDASKDTNAEKNDIVKNLMKAITSDIKLLDTAGSHYDEVMKASHRLCGVKMNDSGTMERKRLIE